MRPSVFPHAEFADYELLDFGEGEKLERFGEITLRRPDPQALGFKRADAATWDRAHLVFERDLDSQGKRGRWRASKDAPKSARGDAPEWTIAFDRTRCILRPTPFKHVGLFPEQASNWRWIEARARELALERPKLLNLFGYTGTASLVAAQSGFAVTHVDASKTSLAWMKENARASGLAEDEVRIVLDDALAFARREVRRKSRYHGILLDPPHFGRGPKGETWQFEDHLAALMGAAAELTEDRAFVVLSAYAFGTSPLALSNLLDEWRGGEVAAGELALPERSTSNARPRSLPCGFCARWTRGLSLS